MSQVRIKTPVVGSPIDVVLPTTSGTLALTSQVGVVGFTGSQNTTSPNDLVNASRLLVDATSTDADAVIQPKGNGALLAQLPDNDVPGGNKRGESAIDLQLRRSSANHVASGLMSAILSGENNRAVDSHACVLNGTGGTASGTYATVIGGENSTASGSHSLVVGTNNVASGLHASILNGLGNQASSNFAVVTNGHANNSSSIHSIVLNGYANSASGQFSVVLNGFTSEAQGTYSIAHGEYCVATGGQSLARGYYSNANGGYADAIGEGCQADGIFSVASGNRAIATGYGQIARSSGGFNYAGDCQREEYIVRRITNNDTQVELTCDGKQVFSAANRIAIADETTYAFSGLVVGRTTGLAEEESAGYKIEGVIDRNAGVTAFVGIPSVVAIGADVIPASTWNVTLEADNDNAALVIKVTGEEAKMIRWGATVKLMKVSGY
jgi:hypothetical protein